jgi:hypothetical protein
MQGRSRSTVIGFTLCRACCLLLQGVVHFSTSIYDLLPSGEKVEKVPSTMVKNTAFFLTASLFIIVLPATPAFLHRVAYNRELFVRRRKILFTSTTDQPTKSFSNPSQAFGKRKFPLILTQAHLKPMCSISVWNY